MKNIILKQITLTDWSAQNLRVKFNEGKTIIKGRNGCGKTSVINAHRWLWTGRIDAVHPANYEVFDSRYPLTKDTPSAIVEEIISVDGCDFTIRKEAKAAFSKRDGVYVKSSSDKYKTFIDEIEFSATQFNQWIEDTICPIKLLPFVLDGIFFSTLCEDDKKKARAILQEIVGEIKKEDFSGDYSCIEELLEKYDVEQIKESASRKKNKLEDRATEIENILKVKKAELSERKLVDYESMMKDIESKKSGIESLDKELLGVHSSIQPIIKKRDDIILKIREKQNLLSRKHMEYNEAMEDSLADIRKELYSIDKENREINAENEIKKQRIGHTRNNIEKIKSILESQEKRIQELRDNRDEWKSKEFKDYKCPVCGQDLPADKLEEARARFNEDVRQHVHDISLSGHSLAEMIKSNKEEIERCEGLITELSVMKPLKSKDKIMDEYNKAEAKIVPFNETEDYDRISKEIEMLNNEIPEIPSVDTNDIVSRKHIIMDELDTLQQKYGGKFEINRLNDDICELMCEQDDNGCEISVQEMIIEKCKEWIEEKASIISHRVNDRLTDCSIQMWSTQKNGERVPDCIILDKNGVKYGKTNTSERIKIDIAIQKMFMKHYGTILPVMVDEAAVFSSFNIPVIDTQHLLIFASDDNKLIVE